MWSTRGGWASIASRSSATNPRLAPTVWMKRRSWPRTLTIRVWLVACVPSVFSAEQSTPWRTERFRGETSEDVVADPGTDRRADPQPSEVDGRVGRPAADVQEQVVHRDQLAGPGKVVQRRGDVVGDHQSCADDGRGLLDARGSCGHDRLSPGEGDAAEPRRSSSGAPRPIQIEGAGRGLRPGRRSMRRPHPCWQGFRRHTPRRSHACRRAPRARPRSAPRVR